MTAEIGILNRRGVALAADSAVTIGQRMTLNNATKVFTLDSSHYIGIMTYGNAEFMEIPWEVIIKSYRENLANNTFNTIEEYANSIIDYTQGLSCYKKSYNNWISLYCLDLLNQLSSILSENNESLEEEIPKLQNILNSCKKIFNFDVDSFKKSYSDLLKTIFLEKFPQGNNLVQSFIELFITYLQSNLFSEGQTGLVIAGYGAKEMFPSIIQITIDGMIQNKIKYVVKNKISTDPEKSNVSASINPFAQHEMVSTVLDGIDPSLNDYRVTQLSSIKDQLVSYFGSKNKDKLDKLFEKNDDEFKKYVAEKFNSPITSMLQSLSVDELGNMAETLVSLTSFKRKYSGAMRTVGGPIDVLVISKGEGPVWLKRKKYFNKDMNEGYFLRRK